MKNDSGDDDEGSTHSNEQGFQVVATTEDKTEISKISKSDEELAAYQSVPAWKRKYIARKEASMNNSSDRSTSRGDSSNEIMPPSSPSPRRTALEETLDRCRNIEDTSTSLHDMKDEHVTEEVSYQKTDAGSSALSGWVSFFSLGGATSSSVPSAPLYSKVLETTDPDAADSIDSLSSVSSVSSASSSFETSPSFYPKGKVHRRQHSPSGVMDLVASE